MNAATRTKLLVGVLLVIYFAIAAALIYNYGTGLGPLEEGHHGSAAYFGNNVSYLDAGSSQLWACDNSPDGWREKAEAYDRQTGDHLFIRDPDGAGGSCGRRDTGRHWEWHRMWGGQDINAGSKSYH